MKKQICKILIYKIWRLNNLRYIIIAHFNKFNNDSNKIEISKTNRKYN